jgi:hypothetical protein
VLRLVIAGAVGALIVLLTQQITRPPVPQTSQVTPAATPCPGAPFGMSRCTDSYQGEYEGWLRQRELDRELDRRGVSTRP